VPRKVLIDSVVDPKYINVQPGEVSVPGNLRGMRLMRQKLTAVFLGSSIAFVAGSVWAQDATDIISRRQDLMKRQSRDLAAVKNFLDSKSDAAAAQAAAADLVQTTASIPGVFPKGTGMAEFPDKSAAKPTIWTDSNKFSEAQKNANSKAVALSESLKTGDRSAVSVAFDAVIQGGIWNATNACGGCHVPFRERRS
jgi:cytochrome c556